MYELVESSLKTPEKVLRAAPRPMLVGSHAPVKHYRDPQHVELGGGARFVTI